MKFPVGDAERAMGFNVLNVADVTAWGRAQGGVAGLGMQARLSEPAG